MKRSGSPMLLFENLDLTPIRSILWTELHREGPGRPVEYNPDPEYLRVAYKRLRAMSESLNGRVKARLALGRFTWSEKR
jgi:hypothetical protein